MRKLHSEHGLYNFLPELKKGELVYNHGKAFQLSDDGYHVNRMRYESYPTMFGNRYAWVPDGVVYQLIGDELFYDALPF